VTRKIFMDTEFLNRGAGHPLELVSIGMIDDTGNEFYGIRVDSPLSGMWRDNFFRENVWQYLPLERLTNDVIGVLDWDPLHPDIAHVMTDQNLREEVLQFIQRDGMPEIWGWCCGFDMVVLSQLFGTFADRPTYMPFVIHDIATLMLMKDVTVFSMAADVPELPGVRLHHALDDAKDVERRYRWLTKTPVKWSHDVETS
jgi:hypothetical protein